MTNLTLIGLALFLGFLGGKLVNKLKFPAVVGYIIFGFIMGPSLVGIYDVEILHELDIISDIALGLIAFLIGGELKYRILKKMGKEIIIIVIVQALGTFFAVGLGVYLLTKKVYMGLIFGALATATAPAGTWVVIRELKAKGRLTNITLAVVGLDDALTIVFYGFSIAISKVFIDSKNDFSFFKALAFPLYESLLAVIVGILMGAVLIYIIKKLQQKIDYLIVTFSFILICSGLADYFHFSLILANMAMGVMVANSIIRIHKKIVEVLENVTPLIYVIFFFLAGAHLQISLLSQMGKIGFIYITARIIGKIAGAYLGAFIADSEEKIKKYLGLAILSQAGVAVGLAILVGKEFGHLGEIGKNISGLVINTVAASTIVFEVIGPLGAKIAMVKSGEAGKAGKA